MTAKSISLSMNQNKIEQELDRKINRENPIYFSDYRTYSDLSYKICEGMHELTDIFLDDSCTIIYPFGTEENPGTITVNSVYMIENPFPDYYVEAQAEVYAQEVKEWGVSKFHGFYTSAWYASGYYIHQHNDGDLILKTGKTYVLTSTGSSDYFQYPNSFFNCTVTQTARFPFRVKIWKLGPKN